MNNEREVVQQIVSKRRERWLIYAWKNGLPWVGVDSDKEEPAYRRGFPGGSVVENPPANAGDRGSMPGSGRSPREGNCNPLQFSCLEYFVDRGACQAPVRGIAKSQIWLRLSAWACTRTDSRVTERLNHLQLPGCSSLGELETISAGQKFVAESEVTIWIAICAERKLGSLKSCVIFLSCVVSEGNGKAGPPELPVWALEGQSHRGASHPRECRSPWFPFHPCVANRASG